MDHILKHIRILVSWTTITMLVLLCSCNKRIYTYNKPAYVTEDTVFIYLNVMEVVDTGYVYGILRNVETEFKKQNFCDRIRIKQYVLFFSNDSIHTVCASNIYDDLTEEFFIGGLCGFFVYRDIPVLCYGDTLNQRYLKRINLKEQTIGRWWGEDLWVTLECRINAKGEVTRSTKGPAIIGEFTEKDKERKMKEFCKYGYVKKRRR